MSSIPPFLCNTPPPIDDIDDDEDFDKNDEETEFGTYGTYVASILPKDNQKLDEILEIPLPQDAEPTKTDSIVSGSTTSQESIETELKTNDDEDDDNNKIQIQLSPNIEDNIEINSDSIKAEIIGVNSNSSHNDETKSETNSQNEDEDSELQEAVNQITDNLENYLIVNSSTSPPPPPSTSSLSTISQKQQRDESPQSLEFHADNLSEEDDCSIGEFQAASIVIQRQYDDNCSLPSLKFDPLSIGDGETVNFDEYTTESPLAPQSSSSSPPSLCQKENSSQLTDFLDDTSSSAFQKSEIQNEDDDDNDANYDKKFDNLPNSIEIVVESTETYDDGNNRILNDCDKNFKNEKNLKSTIVTEDNTDDNNDDDDEFNEFEAFNTTSDSQNLEQTIVFNSSPVNVLENNQIVNTSFEADFSQFETSETMFKNTNDFTVEDSNSKKLTVAEETQELEKNDNSNVKNDDNEEDFGDFSDFHTFQEVESTIIKDESKPLTLLITGNLDEKIKSIVEMMFPLSESFVCTEEESDNKIVHQRLEDVDKFITVLKDIDQAKSLEFQWVNSDVKHSLIKSIGIDSRNILYGEKWNSGMPRFAANLSFSPLEPLKPTKISNDNNKMTTSGITTSSISNNNIKSSFSSSENKSKSSSVNDTVPAAEFDWNSSGLINPLDASHAHTTLLLDLDLVVANLDRLKLDPSSSSPCSSSSSSFAAAASIAAPVKSTKSSSIKQKSTTILTKIMNHAPSFKITAAAVAVAPTAITDVTDSNASIANDDNDLLQSTWTQFEITSSPSTLSKCLDDDDDGYKTTYFDDILLNMNNGDGQNIDIHYPTLITANSEITESNGVINNAQNISICKSSTNHIENANNHKFFNLNCNNNHFDRYLDCRIKEILQERKMDTTSQTTQSSCSNIESIDVQQESKTDNNTEFKEIPNQHINIRSSIVSNIDDNDHDNITSISDDSINTTSQHHSTVIQNDDLPLEIYHQHHHHPHHHHHQIGHSSFMVPLKETHIFTPEKEKNATTTTKEIAPIVESTVSVTTTETIVSEDDFDFKMAAAGIIINENVVKKEYRDVEYNPKKLTINLEDQSYSHPSALHHNQKQNTNDQNDFQTIIDNEQLKNIEDLPQNSTSQNTFTFSISDVIDDSFKSNTNEVISTTNMTNEFDNLKVFTKNNDSKSTDFISEKLENNSSKTVEDEFTDFQCAPPPAPPLAFVPTTKSILLSETVINTIPNNQKTQLSPQKQALGSEMILSPAILLPRSIEIEKSSCDSSPKINWPEPGINPEELERLEKMFPQSKPSPTKSKNTSSNGNNNNNNDDDDWSDFVSVQPQSFGITQNQHSINISNNQQQNDDEWSDFVYSPPPLLQSTVPQASISSISCVSNSFLKLNAANQQSFTKQSSGPSIDPNQYPSQYYSSHQSYNNINHSHQLHRHQQHKQQSQSYLHDPLNLQKQLPKRQQHQSSSTSLIPDMAFVNMKNPTVNRTPSRNRSSAVNFTKE